MIVHTGACAPDGTRDIPGHKGYPNGPGGRSMQYSSDRRGVEVRPHAWVGHAGPDGTETITVWGCSEVCLVPDLDEQSGVILGSGHIRHSRPHGGFDGTFATNARETVGHTDVGGASRFFPQFADQAAMSNWCRLLLGDPPED